MDKIDKNMEEKIKMAKEIAKVRKTGKVNMFDKKGVIFYLEKLGYIDTANYLKDNEKDFGQLLILSGDY
jgi:hypothetical protein